MNRVTKTKAYSLAEMMIFMFLAVLVSGIAMDFYVKGTALTDETHKAVMVQQDIRAVVEYITRDMNGAYWVLNPEGGHEHNLVLIKYGSGTTRNRLALNLTSGDHFDYPFSRAGQSVSNKIDAYKVTYEYDESEKTVFRTEEQGIFIITSAATSSSLATEYSFEVNETAGLMNKHPLATNVKQFDLHYFGYESDVTDSRGALKQVWDIKYTQAASDEVKIAMTACILLRVMANYKEGMYQDGGKHKSPELTILTKIWSHTKLKDEMYKEYFSSVDWNLQF